MAAADGYRAGLVGRRDRGIEVGDQVLVERDIEVDIPGKILCFYDGSVDIELKPFVDIKPRNIDLRKRTAEYQASHLGKDHILDFLMVVIGGKGEPAIEKGCVKSNICLSPRFPFQIRVPDLRSDRNSRSGRGAAAIGV